MENLHVYQPSRSKWELRDLKKIPPLNYLLNFFLGGGGPKFTFWTNFTDCMKNIRHVDRQLKEVEGVKVLV
jgi:hypothetical protein